MSAVGLTLAWTADAVRGRIVSGEEVAKKIEQGDKIKRLSVP